MSRYRAVLMGVPPVMVGDKIEGTVQLLGQRLPALEDWAKNVVRLYAPKFPEARVDIYEVTERVVKSIVPK